MQFLKKVKTLCSHIIAVNEALHQVPQELYLFSAVLVFKKVYGLIVIYLNYLVLIGDLKNAQNRLFGKFFSMHGKELILEQILEHLSGLQ
jgi:hypothetical protein